MCLKFKIFPLLLAFILLSTCPQAEGGCEILGHDILVELDLKSHSLSATDTLSMRLEEGSGAQNSPIDFLLNNRLHIDSVSTGRENLEWRRPKRDHVKEPHGSDVVEVYLPPSTGVNDISLKFSYHGVLYEPLDSRRAAVATVTPEFVYLTPMSNWYPDLPSVSLATFRVTVRVPSGYEAITHGRLVERKEEGKSTVFVWEADYPSDSCFLLAAKYKLTHDVYNDIDIYTYFFPEEQELSESYMEATKRYLKIYEEMLGPYPFSRFSVVENLFPTGYGMPSYTLLGRAALKLPFIVHISLGHEVAHNWWGNSVFTRPEHGNWCEGLTTYVADYHYKELINPTSAMEYRRDILRTYANYMYDEADFSLEGFSGGDVPRSDKALRSVLYGKCAMVFHMLKTLLGPETFSEGLKSAYEERRWKQTSWADFETIFERVSGEDLGWFFRQWVYERGAPLLALEDVKVEEAGKGDHYSIHLELSQEPPAYRLTVPVLLVTEDGKEHSFQLEMDSVRQSYTLTSKSRPKALYVDPGFDIFRRLLPEETPPTLDKVLGDREMLIVYPTEGGSRLVNDYKAMSLELRHHAKIKPDTKVNEEDLSRGLFLLGSPDNNLVVKKLQEALPPSLKFENGSFVLNGTKYDAEEMSLFFCLSNPYKTGTAICIFFGLSPEAVKESGHKLTHYGKYSYVLFDDGTSIDKEVFPKTQDPLSMTF